jgi:hypothetical protein
MGKVFGILLFVIALWLGLQYYTRETPPASDPEQRAATPAQRVGERVSESLAEGAERQEALLPGSD